MRLLYLVASSLLVCALLINGAILILAINSHSRGDGVEWFLLYTVPVTFILMLVWLAIYLFRKPKRSENVVIKRLKTFLVFIYFAVSLYNVIEEGFIEGVLQVFPFTIGYALFSIVFILLTKLVIRRVG